MSKYADDCTASESIPNGELPNMQKVLDGLQNWATTNNMLLNSKKSKDMWISFCKNSIEPDLLRINDSCLERVSIFKLLGVWQQDNLCWNYHVEQTVKKASQRLYFLRECRKANLPTEIGITIYCTKTRPLLEYASPLWGGLPKYFAEELQSIQNKCLDIIGIPRTSLPMPEDRCNVATKRKLERIVNNISHPNEIFLTKPNTSHGYNLRSKPGSVAIPKSGSQRHANSFMARAARLR